MTGKRLLINISSNCVLTQVPQGMRQVCLIKIKKRLECTAATWDADDNFTQTEERTYLTDRIQ